jgi:hypothetical protein
MTLTKILLACFCLVAMAGAGWSQTDNSSEGPGIPGYFEPETHVFKPLVRPRISTRALSTFAGKFSISFTITVGSAISTTTPIACNVSASVDDVNTTTFVTSNIISDEASITATRLSATSAKCTVTFSYSWQLGNAGTDKVELSYSLTAGTTSPPSGDPQPRLHHLKIDQRDNLMRAA